VRSAIRFNLKFVVEICGQKLCAQNSVIRWGCHFGKRDREILVPFRALPSTYAAVRVIEMTLMSSS
jgi:hypothetical protein